MEKHSLFGSLIYFSITMAGSCENIGIPWPKYVHVVCKNFVNWKLGKQPSKEPKQKQEKYKPANQ